MNMFAALAVPMLALGPVLYWLMKDGRWPDQEEWMALKKSERFDRVAEILDPILNGFREAHENGHPGLAGVVAGLSRSVAKMREAGLDARHAEEAEAQKAQRDAEAAKAKVKADAAYEEQLRMVIRKEEQERADRRIADTLNEAIKDARGGAIPGGPETPPPVAQRDPKKGGKK